MLLKNQKLCWEDSPTAGVFRAEVSCAGKWCQQREFAFQLYGASLRIISASTSIFHETTVFAA